MKKFGILIAAALLLGFVACDDDDGDMMYENGTYKAETADYSYGWLSFMEVTIADDELTVVGWDARDENGGLKSETTSETYPMNPHPTVWVNELNAVIEGVNISTWGLEDFEASLAVYELANHDADGNVIDLEYDWVDGITGATHATHSAYEFLDLILKAAKEGDTSTQILPTE